MQKQKTILKRFGEKIRALRKERGMSQEKFAELCGLDRTYISGIERGNRNISLVNIQVIAIALNVSLQELFTEVEKQISKK